MPLEYHDHSGDRHDADLRYDRAQLDATWSGDVWDQAISDARLDEMECDDESDE